MKRSQNGWPVLEAHEVRRWEVPLDDRGRRSVVLPAAPGAPGFVLAHLALWFHEEIEPLGGPVPDDWGWASRPIAGTNVTSNHASGTAVDLNATKHPAGVPIDRTFDRATIMRIRARMDWYGSLVAVRAFPIIRWGGDFVSNPDGMHFELMAGRAEIRLLAVQLENTPRGRIIREHNPVLTIEGKKI